MAWVDLLNAGPCYTHAAAVDLSSADWTGTAKAVYVGGAGNVKVDTTGGESGVTLTGVTAGSIIALAVKKIYKTGTNATTLTVLW